MGTGLNVLGITQDRWAIKHLRLQGPLESLRRQGLIDNFYIIDYMLNPVLDSDVTDFDVVICQRSLHKPYILALDNLDAKFILDVDDNLLAKASYRSFPRERDLFWGLLLANDISVTSQRLASLLEKYTGLPIPGKAHYWPNSLPYPKGTMPEPTKPEGIFWIQSEISALTSSKESIMSAVNSFSKKYELPIHFIGKFSELDRYVLDYFEYAHSVGRLDFIENLNYLQFSPTMLGVAPLETKADEETLDFVSGKSDLKMLLFSGYGHPGVYSDSPPYLDTDITASTIVSNSTEAWRDGLEYAYKEGWKKAAGESEGIRAQRHIDVVSKEHLYPLLQKNILSSRLNLNEYINNVRVYQNNNELVSAALISLFQSKFGDAGSKYASMPIESLEVFSRTYKLAHILGKTYNYCRRGGPLARFRR